MAVSFNCSVSSASIFPGSASSSARSLFESFFAAPQSLGTGEALLAAETRLMDDAQTSHPFYWAGFALIGDGERPLFHGN